MAIPWLVSFHPSSYVRGGLKIHLFVPSRLWYLKVWADKAEPTSVPTEVPLALHLYSPPLLRVDIRTITGPSRPTFFLASNPAFQF